MLQVQTKAESNTDMTALIKMEELSSRYRLLKVIPWVLKFMDCLKHKSKCKASRLMNCDIKEAEKTWIRDVHGKLRLEKCFEQLKGMLNVTEVEGILRCEGRLENMNLPYEAKKPCLLPKDCPLIRLVLQDCNQRITQGSVNATLAEVRRQFWIPKGRQVVKKILKKCDICTRD